MLPDESIVSYNAIGMSIYKTKEFHDGERTTRTLATTVNVNLSIYILFFYNCKIIINCSFMLPCTSLIFLKGKRYSCSIYIYILWIIATFMCWFNFSVVVVVFDWCRRYTIVVSFQFESSEQQLLTSRIYCKLKRRGFCTHADYFSHIYHKS